MQTGKSAQQRSALLLRLSNVAFYRAPFQLSSCLLLFARILRLCAEEMEISAQNMVAVLFLAIIETQLWRMW